MSSYRLQTPLRRKVRRKVSVLAALFYVASGLIMATLSVGFGMWLLFEAIDLQRPPVSYNNSKKLEARRSPRIVDGSESVPMPKTASVDRVRFSIEQGAD